MAIVKTDERNYQNIANAIRAKTGSSGAFTPGEMDAAILSIPTGSSGSGLTEEVKQALLDCFENVAWINDQGQTYYDALEAALYPPANLVSISAVFTQGSAVIYDTDSLDTLKQYLVVTANYDDSSMQTVTDYTLSGTLTSGTSVITVSYSGKTTTFNVTVTHTESPVVQLTNVGNSNYVTLYSDDGVTQLRRESGMIRFLSNDVFSQDTLVNITVTQSGLTTRNVYAASTDDDGTTGDYAVLLGTAAETASGKTYTVKSGHKLLIFTRVPFNGTYTVTATAERVV